MIELEDMVRKTLIEMIESDIPHKEKIIKYNKFVDYICDLIEEAKQILESAVSS